MKTTRRNLSLFGVVVTAAVTIGWLSHTEDRLLISNTAPVARTINWNVDRGPDSCITYGWLSADELLFCASSDPPIRKLNVRTGEEYTLTQLGIYFHSTKGDVDGLVVSPDRNWAMWTGGADTTVCSSIDGTVCRQYNWPKNGYVDNYWLGESGARWIEIRHRRAKTDGPGPVICSLLHEETARTDRERSIGFPHVNSGSRSTVATDEPNGIFLWEADSPPSRRQLTTPVFNVTRYSSNGEMPHPFPQHVPKGCRVENVSIAPDGKRAAWLLSLEKRDPLRDLLDAILRRPVALPTRTLSNARPAARSTFSRNSRPSPRGLTARRRVLKCPRARADAVAIPACAA